MSIATLPHAADAIGRFRIERTLGQGAQGTVYLAWDVHLERQVALKSVGQGRGAAECAQRLLAEARTLGKLNHPHLATVFDALEYEGSHYLVLEYVAGETLEARLRGKGALEKTAALQIALQVLDGLAHAHARNIIHRDIKPSNIIIDAVGNARLLDFGIAVAAGTRDAPAGTPQYASPETIDEQAAGKTADVFSFALVLYEMLTGRPAVAGASAFEIMHKIANLPIPAPSTLQSGIDERLDDILLKGLIKNPQDRYQDAAAMHAALLAYLQPAEATPGASGNSQHALDFVLMRMRVKSNFPALSQTISTINRITASDDESMQTLTTTLLKDFSLTNKLLRLVNSSTYGQFGGNISTISRAVMILGFDVVRNLAITLILLEHLQNRHQATQLRDHVICALFNGIMTRQLLPSAGGGDHEEGYICGVFFNLGRLLAMYYLYDEWVEIENRMRAGSAEPEAARAVLGVTLEELGIGIARSWNLPERIVRSMERIDGLPPPAQAHHKDALRIAANAGDILCQIATRADPAEKSRQLDHLAKRYKSRLPLTARDYSAAVEEGVAKFIQEASLLIHEHGSSPMLAKIRGWSSKPAETAEHAVAAKTADDMDAGYAAAQALAGSGPDAVADAAGADQGAVLTAGIQDVTNSLVNGCSLNDVLRMILETMYRGIGFERVLLALRDTRGNRMAGRFGFGAEADVIAKAFTFELSGTADVFQLAVAKNLDLVIADSSAANISSRIPEWHRTRIGAGSFMLLPIAISGRCVGLFYGDRLQTNSLVIETAKMSLLKTLRNQAVLAFKQR